MAQPRTIDADIVVIGAGPSGSAIAWRLAQGGRDVTVLDRGGWFDPAAVGRDAPDFELRRERGWSANPNIRQGADDTPVDDADSPIKPMIGNGIGGGSIHWSAHIPRMREEDFRTASLDGVADDWPLSYADLAPYYTLNEEMLGLAQIAGDPSSPPQTGRRMPMPTTGAHGRRLAEAFDRLGWHWWPVDLVVGRDADQPETVHCTHIGPCDIGCPSRIRSATDRAYMTDAVREGARVLPHMRVARLAHDRDRVTHAVCHDADGEVHVHGRQFILAANGMGTPRLLLLSASDHHPDGLANRSGLVGRNLMLHPYGRMDALFDTPLGAWAPGEKAGLVSMEFYSTRREHGFVRGLKLQLNAGPPPAALARGAITGRALPWGRGHHAAFAARFDHICGLTVCAEDLPEQENRITLSASLTDRDGLPAPKMIYRVSENSRRILDFGLDRAGEVLREAGAVALYPTPLRSQAGFHLMGTARMGIDPGRSVVNSYGRCHDVPNLFVADASVFVTSTAVNPTHTGQALALRTADHILAAGS